MSKKIISGLALVLLLAVFSAAPVSVLAGEHGGKEHGGSTNEHGGSHAAAGVSDSDTVAAAAKALRSVNPALASELDRIADELK